MLVLTRKIGEKLYIGDNITVMVVDVKGDRVRLALEAPRDIPILREELLPFDPSRKGANKEESP